MINAARGARRGQFRAGGGAIRIAIRVRPGAPRTRVGGAYGDALVVHVNAPAVDGRATAAALRAVAAAFGVPHSDVTLVTGATSRTKIVDVAGDEAALHERAATLLGSDA
jgi:hypothetical protein